MYKFRPEKLNEIKSKYKLSYLAEEIGVSIYHLSKIINGKLNCKKPLAYCITKTVDQEKEINDYFIEI